MDSCIPLLVDGLMCYYHYSFSCFNCPRFGQWQPLKAGFCALLKRFYHSLSISLLSGIKKKKKIPGSSSAYLRLTLELVIAPKSSICLLMKWRKIQMPRSIPDPNCSLQESDVAMGGASVETLFLTLGCRSLGCECGRAGCSTGDTRWWFRNLQRRFRATPGTGSQRVSLSSRASCPFS